MKSTYYRKIVSLFKNTFQIRNLTQTTRKHRRKIEKLIYRNTFTASDVVAAMKDLGMKKGDTIIVHCAMNNFYNYRGTVNELIDAILEALGPEGTLCMPAYPNKKYDTNIVFDVRNSKSAAGVLSEVFRNYPGVIRSLNQLHSVCALGPNADYLVSEHHLSEICFDRKSPFFKIGELNGLDFTLGLPKHFVGTVLHVSEALVAPSLKYFADRFSQEVVFNYIDENGNELKHTMKTRAKEPYVKRNSTSFIDRYFDPHKYGHKRLSNIWINCYDVKYTIDRLSELAYEGKVVYKYPKFYK